MESLKNLIHVSHGSSGRHRFHIIYVSLLNEDLVGSSFQCVFVFSRERFVANFDKIMVEGSVGVLWRTDGHIGEVQVVDGVGGDRGGDGILLPLLVRLADQDSSSDEPKTDN